MIAPNTPVLPFVSSLSKATFVDPSAMVVHGQHIVVGSQTYIGPYALLNSATGYIKIGSKSDILSNATIISNPNNLTHYPTNVEIGDEVSIGYGATIEGPSIIGAYGTSAKDTGIGNNALIDGATIKPGAIVGSLARVGPGVTIPSGMYVIPGSNVTTEAEATNPALGMVEAIPAATMSALVANITRYPALAAGYTNLYQGNSATGASIITSITGISAGNLSAVEGVSAQPGNSTTTAVTNIAFETAASTEPTFIGPYSPGVMANLFNFPARIIGNVNFNAKAITVQRALGKHDAILGDQGQPITFAAAPFLSNNVSISSPGGGFTITSTTTTTDGVTKTTTTVKSTGVMQFGTNFSAGSNSVILGGTGPVYKFGDNVSVGNGAVVSNSQIGTGTTIGARAYVSGSTLAPGTVIPAGEILINNKVVGQIQW